LFVQCLSCNKDTTYLPDSIAAGQKEGKGIFYYDFEPDVYCVISDPWNKQDTSINLDLNMDGVIDFIFHRDMCHPSFLGGDCDAVTLIPSGYNEICVIPTEYPNPVVEPCMHSSLDLVDTLPSSVTINENSYLTNIESLIYQYSWIMNSCSLIEGLWPEVTAMNQGYIGFKLVKDNKNYFGWIGMYCDPTNYSKDFIITDYAIIRGYQEEM
jgi:hypothetical protein